MSRTRAIEAKTRRGGATPSLSITSESQLDERGVDSLFLQARGDLVELDEAPTDATDGVTLHGVAERIRGRLLSLDPGSSGILETRLFEERVSITQHVGSILIERDHQPWLDTARARIQGGGRLFRPPLDLEGATRIYLVTGNFPPHHFGRDTPGCLEPHRTRRVRVRYSVSLADCEPFATSVSALNEALAER